NQFFVSDALAANGVNERVQPEQGVALHVARVQTERKFVNVSLSVFRANVMKDAVDTAFENRPNRLYAVRVDRANMVAAAGIEPALFGKYAFSDALRLPTGPQQKPRLLVSLVKSFHRASLTSGEACPQQSQYA